MFNKDSVSGTFTVIIAFCLVCSVLVSTIVVLLEPFKAAAIANDRQVSILRVAGIDAGRNVAQAYSENITARLIDMRTGRYTDDAPEVADGYNFAVLAKKPETSLEIPHEQDIAGLRVISDKMPVYFVRQNGEITQVILPFYGPALWSTVYGYVSLDTDFNHIKGVTFYSHGETPGLGGEIDNPRWQGLWVGKRFLDDARTYRFRITKTPDSQGEGREYDIDSLAGATLTARGVDNSIRYWIEYAYKSYLENGEL